MSNIEAILKLKQMRNLADSNLLSGLRVKASLPGSHILSKLYSFYIETIPDEERVP